MFLKLAVKSLLNRKGSVLLTLLAMTVSIFVLLGVEHIRQQAKESFSNTISGVDLIVGARTGSLNLLLYSVFRIGSPTNNINWQSVEKISSSSYVDWVIPISLGDSHQGYRVLGTTQDYFQYFSYGKKHHLNFKDGKAFSNIFDVVLGSEVATKLGYKLEDNLVLAHGVAKTSFSLHDDKPFKVVGILASTGTPVDQTLHVSLQGIEAIHIDWQKGVKKPGGSISHEQIDLAQLTPKNITALMLGLKSKMTTFRVRRDINNYGGEPLLAILPGVALSELWQMMSVLEKTLRMISILVLVAALMGLSATLLASIRERSHEIQLLRVIGAPPSFLFKLVELEAILISTISVLLSVGILYVCLIVTEDFLTTQFGLYIGRNFLSENSFYLIMIIMVSTVIAAAIPSLSVYKKARTIRS